MAVSPAPSSISQMRSVKDLQQAISSPSEDTIYIDVRTIGEFKGSPIHGTENILLSQIDIKRDSIKAFKTIYIHCHNGIRTRQAIKKLNGYGIKAIAVDGGLVAWKKAGFNLFESNEGSISIIRQVQITAGSLVLLGAILSQFIHLEFIWLSGAIGAGLLFTGIIGKCMMAMVLEKMPWNK